MRKRNTQKVNSYSLATVGAQIASVACRLESTRANGETVGIQREDMKKIHMTQLMAHAVHCNHTRRMQVSHNLSNVSPLQLPPSSSSCPFLVHKCVKR